MRRYLPAVILAPALVVLAACSGSDTTSVTVLGYTVVIKTAPPTTAQAGASVPIAFTVTENESNGSSKPASGKSFTVTVTAGGGTVNGAASAALTTGSDGSVSLTWVLGSTVGTQTIRGSVSADKFLDVNVTATAPPVSNVVVTIATPSITLGTVGDQATAVLKDANGNVLQGRTVTWQSSNTTVATISATGVITTVGVGTSTITATSEGQSGGALLTVTSAPVATVTVTLAASSIPLGTVGDQATAVLKDAGGNVLQGRTVTWQSSNTAVATVSPAGVITTVAAGTSTITATSEGISGAANVTVTPAQTIYWTFFNGQATTPQIQSASLPLTAGSALTNVPPSATLRVTAGMTFDASGRLWVISYPQGGGIVAAVFVPPVTAASAPALVFTLPPSGDIDFLSFDRAGNLWASDYTNNVEYMFTPPFTASRTLVPSVTLSLPGFSHPAGNAVDAAGNVYVSNIGSTGTNSIAVFTAPVSSASVPAFYLNGLTGPGGLIFDAEGNLYASSHPSGQKSIVRYNRNNLVSGALPNIVDMTGLGTQNYEAAFAFDAAGNLFVADCGAPNNGAGIRSYPTATSPFSSTLAPSATYTNSTINLGCVWGIAIR
ncbi:MAG TPA: Ig-like domain-containing protein [Gemmatimonadaceae bacterium]|nr:Ig-like domain-containing protein [Gemmatimonadaceae bacterium]